jgi:3-methyl-2-oxobutanoate hydroxymethyltransferase
MASYGPEPESADPVGSGFERPPAPGRPGPSPAAPPIETGPPRSGRAVAPAGDARNGSGGEIGVGAARSEGCPTGARTAPGTAGRELAARVTAPAVRARKGSGHPLVMVTAYDAPGARIADGAGVDLILVGDSLAMVVLGFEDTLQVTVADMAHHTAAVARARPRPMVVADLPWMSYHTGPADAVTNAATLVRAGAQAVKLEGGRKRLPVVEVLVDAEIPVMGHLGLTPQSFHAMGGFKVQGKDLDAAKSLVEDAASLAAAGCFAIVLEGIPDVVAQLITDSVPVPTIGIGAGPHCDGQVLVLHDLLGLDDQRPPKFVRRYANLQADATAALAAWADDVRAGRFPDDSESYHLAAPVVPALVGR